MDNVSRVIIIILVFYSGLVDAHYRGEDSRHMHFYEGTFATFGKHKTISEAKTAVCNYYGYDVSGYVVPNPSGPQIQQFRCMDPSTGNDVVINHTINEKHCSYGYRFSGGTCVPNEDNGCYQYKDQMHTYTVGDPNVPDQTNVVVGDQVCFVNFISVNVDGNCWSAIFQHTGEQQIDVYPHYGDTVQDFVVTEECNNGEPQFGGPACNYDPGDTFSEIGEPVTQGGTLPDTMCIDDCYAYWIATVGSGDPDAVSIYETNGEDCSVVGDSGGTGGDGTGTGNPPTEGPAEDGNTTDEAATDENQEVISRQLHEQTQKLSDIESDTTAIAKNTQKSAQELEVINERIKTGNEILSDIENNTDRSGDSVSDTGCGTPPACDGPPVECAQYRKLWGIECGQGDRVASSGVGCDVEPSCSGDDIDCLILKEQWETKCSDGGFSEVPDVSGQDFQPPAEELVDMASRMSEVTNQPGFLTPGQCPTETLNLSMGQQILDMELICQLAISLNPLVLIIGALVSARLFYTGLIA